MDPGVVLWPVAVAMATVVALLVRWAASARTQVAAGVVVFLLAMMAAMLVAVAIYFSAPSNVALVAGIWVAAAIMAASVFPVFALFLREARRGLVEGAGYRPTPVGSPAVLAIVVTLVVLAAELSMGRGFALADRSGAVGGPPAVLAATVVSPFFLFPMALEMTLSLAWLQHRFPLDVRVLLASQAAMMFFAPPALGGTLWELGSAAATTVAMSAAVGVVTVATYRGRRLGSAERSLWVLYLVATALAGVGLAQWALGAGVGVFGAGMVVEMGVFFTAVVAPERFSTTQPPAARAPPPPAPPNVGD